MAIVVESVDQIEVYVNEARMVIIKQTNGVGEEDDIVAFPIKYIKPIVDELMVIADVEGQE